MIDTLILSDGGPSGVAYALFVKTLINHDIFQKTNLKHIITTSVGITNFNLRITDF